MNRLQTLKKNLSHLSILYVEDEDDVRKETKIFLNRIFNNITMAINGEEGLTTFKNGSYDVVISDLKMPKMNGRDMLKHIHKINDKTVLIVMTASDSEIDVTRTICDAYLHKPVMFMDFVNILERLQDRLVQQSI